MKTPKRIQPLIDEGLVDTVICELMSGKEATVYVVRCGEEICCAKVYKESNQRHFHKSTNYTEGRRIKTVDIHVPLNAVVALDVVRRRKHGRAQK